MSDRIYCPWCGKKLEYGWLMSKCPEFGGDKAGCPHCGKPVDVSIRTTEYFFSVRKGEEEDV